MHFHQVICAFLVFVNHVCAKGYGGTGSSIGGAGGYGGGYGSEAGGYGGGYGSGQNLAPKPYGFGYQAPDPSGNSHFRKESGDASGNVQGSYGYTDQQGLYRQVDYVANEGGFKANVKTNEPGTDGKENPADVNVEAQQPPPGVQEKYTRPSGYGAGGGSGGIGGGNGGGSGGGGIGGGHGQIGGSSGYGGTSGIGGSGGYGGGYGGRSAGGSFKLGGGIGGSSGQFSGIQRSTSGKSGY